MEIAPEYRQKGTESMSWKVLINTALSLFKIFPPQVKFSMVRLIILKKGSRLEVLTSSYLNIFNTNAYLSKIT